MKKIIHLLIFGLVIVTAESKAEEITVSECHPTTYDWLHKIKNKSTTFVINENTRSIYEIDKSLGKAEKYFLKKFNAEYAEASNEKDPKTETLSGGTYNVWTDIKIYYPIKFIEIRVYEKKIWFDGKIIENSKPSTTGVVYTYECEKKIITG